MDSSRQLLLYILEMISLLLQLMKDHLVSIPPKYKQIADYQLAHDPSLEFSRSEKSLRGAPLTDDRLLLAGLPLQMQLLGEGDGCIVVCHLPRGRRVGARQRDAVVDVQDPLSAAWRPDDACGGDDVLCFVGQPSAMGTCNLKECVREKIGWIYSR